MSEITSSGRTEATIPVFPSSIEAYNNDIIKSFIRYTNINTTAVIQQENIPDIIPANAHDIGNYIAKYGIANFQIQVVLSLNGRLDYNKLVRAVRLSIDAEPVLGCRFVKSDPPYWKRFEDIDNMEKFCSIEEVDNPEEGIQSFLQSPMDMDRDPMLFVRVVRSENHDTLCLKINHVCSDAAGLKDYIRLLSDIYSRIDREDADFIPITPSNRDRKDLAELKTALGYDNLQTTWGIHQQIPYPTWNFPWKNGRTGASDFSICRIPSGHLGIMSRYSKARGATINDLILTAVFRAMFKISNPLYGIPMDIPVTIDLRRYLSGHKADAIRNLSGGLVIRIDRRPYEPFKRTLSRVMTFTNDIRKKHPSMLNILWQEYIENFSFRQLCTYYKCSAQVVEFASQSPFYIIDKCSPALSNCGFISNSLIKFGDNTVIDAYIIPPVVRAPGILLVASTYNDIMTLSVGYYKSSVRKSVMDNLLNKIKEELAEGCKE